ncbi:hypothetical protein ID866_5147 [Astraeus odoratus]|nr:hypothetical protein ID866_5147 [Astraeus odoratus]
MCQPWQNPLFLSRYMTSNYPIHLESAQCTRTGSTSPSVSTVKLRQRHLSARSTHHGRKF